MARPLFRVHIAGAKATFQTLAVAGQAMLDRWNAADKPLANWLGRFVGQPQWTDDDVCFYVRDEQGQQLAGLTCEPVTEADLRGPLKAELAELQKRVEAARPSSPREKALHAHVTETLLQPPAGKAAVASGCQLFKYRDLQGKLRLAWCYGYEPAVARVAANPKICPHAQCAALQMRQPGAGERCASCDQELRPGLRARRRSLAVLGMLLLVTLAGVGTTYALLQWPLTLTGRITHDEDQQPIANAIVRLKGLAEPVVTDAEGAFQISGLRWGGKHVQVDAPGFAGLKAEVSTTPFRQNSIELALKGASHLHGRVSYRLGDREVPIAGASVKLGDAPQSVQTDQKGHFKLSKLKPGAISVNVQAPGFREQTLLGEATSDGSQVVSFQLVGEGKISGRVVYQGDANLPVTDAVVSLAEFEALSVRTSSAGQFQFDQLPPGDQALKIAAPGFKPAAMTAKPGDTTLVASLVGDAVLKGEVLRSDSKAPVPGAEIRVVGTPFVVKTNSEGTFQLNNVRSGPLRLSAQAPGLVGVLTYELPAQQTGDVIIPVSGSLSAAGRVIDSVSKEPIAGATVSVAELMLTTTTDREGKFNLPGLMEGKVELSIQAAKYLPSQSDIELSSNRSQFHDVELHLGAFFKGRVLSGKNQQVLEGAEIALGDDGPKSKADDKGEFLLTSLAAGTRKITVSAPGHFPTTLSASLEIDNETVKDITLPLLASVKGVVLAAHDRSPLAGVTLGVAETGERLKSGPDGTFEFAQVPAGELSFAAKGDGYEPLRWKHKVKSGPQQLPEIVLVGNTLVRGIAFKANVPKEVVEGVALEVTAGNFKAKVKSAADGSFEVGKLPPGEVTVKAVKGGYQDAKVVKVVGPNALVINVPLTPATRVPLVPGTEVPPISGTAAKVLVFDSADQARRPLAAAEVAVQLKGALQKAVRLPDNTFELKGVAPGSLELHARSPGFAATVVEAKFVAGTILQVPLQKLRAVQGLVVDASKPTVPISNAKIAVTIGDTVETAVSDRNGKFTVNLPSRTLYVLATAKGYRDTEQDAVIPAAGPAELRIEMPVSRNLHGSVVNAVNNQPVPGVTVQVDDSNGKQLTTVSDERGLFEFPSLPATDKIAYVSKAGFESLELKVSGDELRIVLSPTLPRGHVRIVLTWGAQPADMDGHLFSAVDTTGIYVNFASKVKIPHEWLSGNALLDVDDQQSFGPETITIVRPGTYKYFVADFASLGDRRPREVRSEGMRRSRAEVRVYYQGGNANVPFKLPEIILGPVWHVFDITLDSEGNVTLTESEDKWSNDLLTGPIPLDYVKPAFQDTTLTVPAGSNKRLTKPVVYKKRNWKSVDGKLDVEATLVRLFNGKLTLKKADGSEIQVTTDKLSDADNAYLDEVRPN